MSRLAGRAAPAPGAPVSRVADRVRCGIVALMWLGYVLGAPSIVVKGALVLGPSLAARALATRAADLTLTAALALDLAATAAGLYDRWPWWDDAVHLVLPALLVPVAAAALTRLVGPCSATRAAAVVVSVAVAWELVELACDAMLGTRFNLGAADSALDLACGVLGAAVGAALLPRAGRPARKQRRLRARPRPAGGEA